MKTQVTRAEGTHQMACRIPFSLHQRFVELAREQGVSVTAKVVELLEREIERHESNGRKAS